MMIINIMFIILGLFFLKLATVLNLKRKRLKRRLVLQIKQTDAVFIFQKSFSHNLRTQLQNINLAFNLLKEESNNYHQKEYVKIIDNSLSEISDLLQQLTIFLNLYNNTNEVYNNAKID